MILYYVRHGDPIYNPDGLTDFGKQQAELLKERFIATPLDRVFTSTSNRAKMTAEPTCKQLGLTPTALDWANEGVIGRDFFVSEDGITTWCFWHPKYRKLFLSPEVTALGDRWFEHPAFAGNRFREGMLSFWKEQDAFFEELGYRHDRERRVFLPIHPTRERVGFFAHGGCGVCFLSSLLDVPYPYYSMHYTEHTTTGVTVIRFEEREGVVVPEVVTFNETPHLFKAGIPNQFKL